MVFSNVWNDAFPPDTQLANLLGQDLRNFRVDVQQRMAAISGLDAAKPAFGSDNTPANWNGILFFATDTGQIYQFNNPSWTNVTADFSSGLLTANSIKATMPVAVANPAGTTAGQVISVPNGFITTNSIIRIVTGVQCTAISAGTPIIQLAIGGDVITPLGTFAFIGDNLFTEMQFGCSNNVTFRTYGDSVIQNGAVINTVSMFRTSLAGNLTGAFTLQTQVTAFTGGVIFDHLSIQVF